MFIQTEQTPNPATLKFLPGRTVMPAGHRQFHRPGRGSDVRRWRSACSSLPEVAGVFLGADFITVTKNGEGDWYELKPAILGGDHGAFHGRPAGAACAARGCRGRGCGG